MNEHLRNHINDFCSEYKLSRRESEIVRTMVSVDPKAIKIGNYLGISANTVRIHLKSINNKLKISSKTEILTKFLNEYFGYAF